MTSTVVSLARSSIGKKVLMASTGFLLFGFVVVHLLGNLQLYLGSARLNQYAAFLHQSPILVWAARAALLVTALLHITLALQLKLTNWRCRPQRYKRFSPSWYTLISRNMFWTGLLLAAFIIYHLLHLTIGTAHPAFSPQNVYHNVVIGFSLRPVVAIYVGAMILLGLHMHHGLWSMFQSVGMEHTRHNRWRRCFAILATWVIVLGNISMPLTVFAKMVR